MKKRLMFTLALALPFIVSCDRGADREEEVVAPTNETFESPALQDESIGEAEQQEVVEGQVIEESSQVINQRPAELPQEEVERGSAQVEYTTKRKITQTLLKEQDIPTIQICETKADLNQMDAQDFQALGFDQGTSQKIVQFRQQQGNFKSVDDLSKIQGISPQQLQGIKQDLGVNTGAQAQEE